MKIMADIIIRPLKPIRLKFIKIKKKSWKGWYSTTILKISLPTGSSIYDILLDFISYIISILKKVLFSSPLSTPNVCFSYYMCTFCVLQTILILVKFFNQKLRLFIYFFDNILLLIINKRCMYLQAEIYYWDY